MFVFQNTYNAVIEVVMYEKRILKLDVSNLKHHANAVSFQDNK